MKKPLNWSQETQDALRKQLDAAKRIAKQVSEHDKATDQRSHPGRS